MQYVWDALRHALRLTARLRDLAAALPDFTLRIAQANGRAPGRRQRERMGLMTDYALH